MNYREIGMLAALKEAGLDDDNECETPGEKIRSKGQGRGLARGKGKGPLGIPLGKKAALGMGGAREGMGGKATCECPKCGHTEDHASRGTPCNEVTCPKCGAKMGPPGGKHGFKGANDYTEIGVQMALKEAGLIKEAELSPEQMAAAKQLFGIGGGLAGATGGGLLGRHLGGSMADKFDIDPETGKLIGAGIGALGGGALGGLAGYNLARMKYPGKAQTPEPAAESVSFVPDEYQAPMGLYPDLYGW